jgi:sigma-B regulation protein RsbU (phosphoserine phosphatase)
MASMPASKESPPVEPASTPAPGRALRLVCSEVWGGNRPIDASVELPGVRGWVYSVPCGGRRGGDVHYLSACGSGVLARVCVADVVGHGEAAAAVSAELFGLVRRYMNRHDERCIMRGLNRRLGRIGLQAMTTAAAATYYSTSGELSVSYAGHPPAWYFATASGEWTRLGPAAGKMPERRPTNLPLAIVDDAVYTRQTLRVARGDRLFLFTDGLVEAPGADGGSFGEDRQAVVLREHGRDSCEGLSRAMRAALEAHVGNAAAHDDVTFMVLEFGPGPPGPVIWTALKNRIVRPRGNSAEFA